MVNHKHAHKLSHSTQAARRTEALRRTYVPNDIVGKYHAMLDAALTRIAVRVEQAR